MSGVIANIDAALDGAAEVQTAVVRGEVLRPGTVGKEGALRPAMITAGGRYRRNLAHLREQLRELRERERGE